MHMLYTKLNGFTSHQWCLIRGGSRILFRGGGPTHQKTAWKFWSIGWHAPESLFTPSENSARMVTLSNATRIAAASKRVQNPFFNTVTLTFRVKAASATAHSARLPWTLDPEREGCVHWVEWIKMTNFKFCCKHLMKLKQKLGHGWGGGGGGARGGVPNQIRQCHVIFRISHVIEP